MQRMIRFRAALPVLLLLALTTPARAQNVVLDEGTFRILRGGRDIGTETFAVRRVGQGADAHLIANAVLEIDLPSGHEQVKPLLRTDPDLTPSSYQLEVSGPDRVELAVSTNGRRFTVHSRTPTGEQEREFRAARGPGLLEDGVAHQYWFLSQLQEGQSVTVLVPRLGIQHRVLVRSARTEAIPTAEGMIQGRHVTFDVDGSMHDVRYDADGKVLRVTVPSTGFAAERTPR